MGYVGYFLIVADFIRFAREQKIPTTCRGSAPGSIVTYTLGITPVDPIRYELPFERFLNPDRVTMPDIDVDFEDSPAGRGHRLTWRRRTGSLSTRRTSWPRPLPSVGIDVSPPDVHRSDVEFTVEGAAIRFGLLDVKNVGQGAIESIIAARKSGGL
jgi:DNA polymerase III alpha subunit